MSPWLWVILLTLAPTLELRASIPYAIVGAGWNPLFAAVIGITFNALLAIPLWFIVDSVIGLLRRIPALDRLYVWYSERKLKSMKRLIDKYGVFGIALFVGVPLPGTGVYSGCVAARLLELRFRDYLLGCTLGVTLAGILVTVAVASGAEVFSIIYKPSLANPPAPLP